MAMHLANAISYITDGEKTQDGALVGSHNCNVDSALQEMLSAKRKYGKLDKRQGYHFIISFKKQEVRPETAMEITQKFVERYFGDDFQCLYATHDNTQHVHSHILFNSVSWRTGKKYRYEKGDWAREIQPIVNELCREYGLSIQDIEVGTKQKTLKKWDKTKQGIFKWNHQIRLDMEDVDHVFDISDTNGRVRPQIWRLDKENEKEILSLLHAGAGDVQDYVREAVESEIYGKGKGYIENISDLCRYHDSQNPEHIYDITKAVIQSAQYMAAARMDVKPPPVSSLLPVLATAPRLMVYGLCSTALSVAGQVLKGVEKVFEMKKEKQRAEMGIEAGKEQDVGKRHGSTEKGCAGQGIPALRHQPHQNADTLKRQGNGSHKGTEKAGYEQLSLSFDGGYAVCGCGRAL